MGLEERRRARAADAERDRRRDESYARAEERRNERRFVLATSGIGFLGDGAFAYLFALFGALAVAGLVFFGHRAIDALPDLSAQWSPLEIGCVMGAPTVIALLWLLFLPTLLGPGAAPLLRPKARFAVEGVAHAIGGAIDIGSAPALIVGLRFRGAAPPNEAILARAREVHPNATLGTRDGEVLLELPRGSSRAGRILQSDTGRMPAWSTRRLFVALWRDTLEQVVLPLDGEAPIASVRVDVDS